MAAPLYRHRIGAVLALIAATGGCTLLARSDPHAQPGGSGGSAACRECHQSLAHAGNHPTAVDYGEAVARAGDGLRPAALLPSEIRLEAGRMDCLSCHDPAPATPARLRLPLAGSALCLACHRR